MSLLFFFFNDTATTEIYTLSLHDALPISGQRVLGLAARALDQVVDLVIGILAGAADVAQALDAGRAAADELGVRSAFQPALGQGARRARRLVLAAADGLVERSPFIQDGHGHRDPAVGPRSLAAQQVQHAVAERLVLDGLLDPAALLAGRDHRRHAVLAVQQGLDLGLDEAVTVVVRRLPQRLLAAAVRDVVADEGGNHLGVADALGLLDGQFLDAVIGHEVQDPDLKRPCHPTALLVAGFAGQQEVVGCPFGQCLRCVRPQAGQAQLRGGLDGGNRFSRQGRAQNAASSSSSSSSGASAMAATRSPISLDVTRIHSFRASASTRSTVTRASSGRSGQALRNWPSIWSMRSTTAELARPSTSARAPMGANSPRATAFFRSWASRCERASAARS